MTLLPVGHVYTYVSIIYFALHGSWKKGYETASDLIVTQYMDLYTCALCQGLSQNFKDVCPKQQIQNFSLSRFIATTVIYSKSLYQLHFIVDCVIKGTLQLCSKRWHIGNIFGYFPLKMYFFTCPKSRFSGNSLSKRGAGQILATKPLLCA